LLTTPFMATLRVVRYMILLGVIALRERTLVWIGR